MADSISDISVQIAAINRASVEIRKIAADINKLDAAAGQTRGFDRLNKSFGGSLKQMALFAGGFIGAQSAMAAFSGGLRGTIGSAIDFESSFAGIRKTMELTEEQFAELERANRSLAKSIPVSVNEINRIGELAGQLGVRGVQNVVKFEDTIAKLAVTTNLSADEAAKSFAQIANIMSLPISEIDRLGAAVVEAGNNFATTEADIVEFTKRIAGAGKIANLSAADVVGIGTAFASVGVEAEAGGTAIQKVLLSITQALATGNENLEVFATTAGMTIEEFRNAEPIERFVSFVEGLRDAGDNAIPVLEQLGLTDQRLLRGFLATANAGDLLRRATDQINVGFQENIALQTEAEKRFATTASQIQLMKNNFSDLGITIGQAVLPAIVNISQAAVAAAPYIEGMVMAFGDGLTGIAGALRSIADVISGAVAPTNQLALAVGGLALAFAFAHPGSAVAIGLAAIIVQIGILSNDTKTASSATLDFENAWYRAEIGILGVIHDIENAILTAIIAPLNLAIDAVNAIGNAGDFLGITVPDIPKIGTEVFGKTAPQKAIDEVQGRIAENQSEVDIRENIAKIKANERPVTTRGSGLADAANADTAAIDALIASMDEASGRGGGGGSIQGAVNGLAELSAAAAAAGLSNAEFVASLELAQEQQDAVAEANRIVAESAFRAQVDLHKLAIVLGKEGISGEAFVAQQNLIGLRDAFLKSGMAADEFILHIQGITQAMLAQGKALAKKSGKDVTSFASTTITSDGVNYSIGGNLTDEGFEKVIKDLPDDVKEELRRQRDESGVKHSGTSSYPKLHDGLDYVPRDMTANLQRGERVVPAKENKGWGGMTFNGPVTVNARGSVDEALRDMALQVR